MPVDGRGGIKKVTYVSNLIWPKCPKQHNWFLDVIYIWLIWRLIIYAICTKEFSGGLIIFENIKSFLWSLQLVSNDWERVIMWKNRYCGHLLGSDWRLERRKCNDKIICLDHPAYKWCNTYTWPQTSLMDFVLLCLLIWLQINSVDIPNKILNTPKR